MLEYVPEEGAGALLGTISKTGKVFPVIDKAVFVGEKLYEARMNQLPDAMVEGNFNICIHNTKQYHTAPEGYYDFWWVPIVVPYSCGTWQGRAGVNGKYLSRYVNSGNTEHMRCTVYAFDY